MHLCIGENNESSNYKKHKFRNKGFFFSFKKDLGRYGQNTLGREKHNKWIAGMIGEAITKLQSWKYHQVSSSPSKLVCHDILHILVYIPVTYSIDKGQKICLNQNHQRWSLDYGSLEMSLMTN